MDSRHDLLRSIPSVERVLEQPEIIALEREVPRWAITESARQVLDETRQAISNGHLAEEPRMSDIVASVTTKAHARSKRGIRRVINGTGVVIHTNLGRSIVSDQALKAVEKIGSSYCTLEFDLSSGRRTPRAKTVEDLIKKIVGCDEAFVVNNNAGAVLLALNSLSEDREVIVSRGELIEIGGSFRLPDVMRKSGALMVEVGTTNRTRLSDYEAAVTRSTGAILKAHLSNFEMTGFVESVPAKDLADLAHRENLVMMEDPGSGALIDLSSVGLPREPMPQDALADGVDIVTFSGDKLLGGPQAGIIVGRSTLIDLMKSNPLARALRVGKLTLAVLEETLRHYLEPESLLEHLPALKMLSYPLESIEHRARGAADVLSRKLGHILSISVKKGLSQVGGGSLPSTALETFVIAVSSDEYSADRLVSMLRCCEVPIIARILEGEVLIDLRTVQPSEDELLIEQFAAAFAGGDS